MNSEFFILIGLFLTITFLITIIIVVFVSKIKTLKSFLEQAKEIDKAKIAKISKLEVMLQEQKIQNINLEKELEYFVQNKIELQKSKAYVNSLKNKMTKQNKEHIEAYQHQETSYKQLKRHYELLSESYHKLDIKYELLKKRNETLVSENNLYRLNKRYSAC